MSSLIEVFEARGDLAHIALFFWASGASSLLMWSLKEMVAAQRRFDEFVRELAQFNANMEKRD